MTERDAKAAVREYLRYRGDRTAGSNEFQAFYDATHAWANSPDGPDALAPAYGHQVALDRLAELLAFKARVKATITTWGKGVYAYEKHFAPILAECAPPKPKFALDQVVRVALSNEKCWRKVAKIPGDTDACGNFLYDMTDGSRWSENYLAALTPEEKG